MGPSGFRNYLFSIDRALGPDFTTERLSRFDSSRRLLPSHLRAVRLPVRLPSFDRLRHLTDRSPTDLTFVGSPEDGRALIVQPLALTEDERGEADEIEVDSGIAAPRSRGSLVGTFDARSRQLVVMEDLNPFWRDVDPFNNPTTPAMGLAMLWEDDLGLWLGVPSWDATTNVGAWHSGGLWHSRDRGRSWQRVRDFSSVGSLGSRSVRGRRSVVVAEVPSVLPRNGLLSPYPSRLVESFDQGQTWTPVDAPPFGSRSEVEIAGSLPNGDQIFRVDAKLFRNRSMSRWRALRVTVALD